MWRWLLAAFALVQLWILSIATPHTDRAPAKIVAIRQQIRSFHAALDSLYKDIGRFPNEAEGLQLLRKPIGVTGWKGPYLTQDIPDDPLGRPYQYRLTPLGYPLIE
ncbi:MAG: type II secretion system protein GspG [Acidobacteria bacterium]|nr:type II secretion system protein GspG [Acidobacteriota bacterium]